MVKLTHIKPPHLNMQMRKDGQMHTWFYLSASGILKQKKKKTKNWVSRKGFLRNRSLLTLKAT